MKDDLITFIIGLIFGVSFGIVLAGIYDRVRPVSLGEFEKNGNLYTIEQVGETKMVQFDEQSKGDL